MKTSSVNDNKKLVRTQKMRNASGASLLELGLVAAFMPLVALIGVNLAVAVFAAGTNDAACKDAARAAGQRANQTDAQNAATAILGRYAASSFFGKPQLVGSVVYNTLADSEGNPQACVDDRSQYGGPAGPGGPFVSISTQSVITLPAPLIFNGAALTSQITLGAAYTFPILNAGSSDNDTESTFPNGPDAAANAACAQEDALALAAENASDQAEFSQEAADIADAAADQATASAASLDALSTQANAALAANPTDPTLQAQAATAQSNATKADAARDAAQGAAAAADQQAATDALAAANADAACDAADAAIQAAYSGPGTETAGPLVDDSVGYDPPADQYQ